MATTTFSGPIRSENGMQLISKNTTTGKIRDRSRGDYPQDSRRYDLWEYFNQLPALNGYLTASEVKDFGSIADGDEEAEEVTVTGAVLGDFALASLSIDSTDLVVTAGVTAANTVTVVVLNNTGGAIDLGSATLAVRVFKQGNVTFDKNKDFEVLGTNMTDALVAFPTAHAGMKMTTAGADQDQAILAPHLDSGQTAWTGVLWGTENSIRYETSIDITNITNVKVWAGFKKTNDQVVATDANQLFFKFQTDATNSETFADFTKLHFIHSIGGVDFISQLPITVAANTQIHLVIEVDANRKATIFVNGIQYNVTTESGTTGTAVTEVLPSQIATKTAALTDDEDFIPYVGIEAGAAEAKTLNVQYLSCSRNVFE